MSFPQLRGSARIVLSFPTVTTQAVTGISGSTATGNGTVINTGGSALIDVGVCWSTSINPTLGDSFATGSPIAVGAFAASMTGLAPTTFYYVRAYATNAIGTSYGDNVTFTSDVGGAASTIMSMMLMGVG